MKKVCMIFIMIVIAVTAGCKQKESEPVAKTEDVKTEVVKTEDVKTEDVKTATATLRKDKLPQKIVGTGDIYMLPLEIRTPKTALQTITGRVKKVVSDQGKNLLPAEDKFHQILFKVFKGDEKTIRFDVLTVKPEEGEIIKEVSGTLEYWASENIKKIDTGLIEFADGTPIKGTNGTIKSIRTDRQGRKIVMLEFDPPLASIRGAEFYSDRQVKLKATRIGASELTKRKVRPVYMFDDPLPAKGRIVLRIAQDTKSEKIDFKAVNISVRLSD